jgi:hypothetical protein
LAYLTYWSIEPYERNGVNFRGYSASANVIGGGSSALMSYNLLCVHPDVLRDNAELRAVVSRFPEALPYPEQIHPLWSNRKKDFLLFLQSLSKQERKVFSQNGEDGIIESLFGWFGTKSKFYVEFGAENGRECNTRLLRDRRSWTGVLMDSHNKDENINLHQRRMTAETINDVFAALNVPKEFDFLSIDIDFNDFWVWKALDESLFRPRVVCVEVNSDIPYNESKTVAYNSSYVWDGSMYFGARCWIDASAVMV